MLARVTYNESIKNSLGYNEDKLRLNKAQCLLAENFLKDKERLSEEDKLRHLERRTSLNDQVKKNCIHIHVNFSPSDKLSDGQMGILAKQYMQKIGLDEQPWLVYRHYDAGHPHMHVLTTNIKADGERINLRKVIFKESLRITREMEESYSLTKLRKGRTEEERSQQITHAKKVVYGEGETKRAISDVLYTVIDQYKYTSIAELNAVLSLYNVRAERGGENTRMYQQGGLVYHALDEQGHKAGTVIKASAFDLQPTLKNLEKKFVLNKTQRLEHAQKIRIAIDWALVQKNSDLPTLQKALQQERISVVTQKDKAGMLQGIQYVDHQTKSVFDGATLGEKYNGEAMQERLVPENSLKQDLSLELHQRLHQGLHL